MGIVALASKLKRLVAAAFLLNGLANVASYAGMQYFVLVRTHAK